MRRCYEEKKNENGFNVTKVFLQSRSFFNVSMSYSVCHGYILHNLKGAKTSCAKLQFSYKAELHGINIPS